MRRRGGSRNRQFRRKRVARILVTGAAGFIGRALCRGARHAPASGHRGRTRRRARRAGGGGTMPARHLRPGNGLGGGCEWRRDRHPPRPARPPQRRRPRATSPKLPPVWLRGAARAGVRRLVYISSIKAMGETTGPGRPFRAGDEPRPGRRLWPQPSSRTERALAAVPGIEITIIRPAAGLRTRRRRRISAP